MADQQQQPETPEQNSDERLAAIVVATLRKVLPKHMEEAFAPHAATLASLSERMKTPATPATPSSTPAGGGQPGGTPQIGDVMALVTDLETKLKREQDARAQEKREAREAKAFADLRTELGKDNRIRPEGVDAAAKLLFHADKVVRVDRDRVVMRLDDEDFDLAEGVARWAQRPEAGLFKQAPGYGGGTKPKGGRPPPARPASPGSPNAGQREDPLAKTLRDLGYT